MNLKKALIWTILKGEYHRSLKEEDKQIAASMPILTALFPGITYYSMSGFHTVMVNYGKPALKKLFPEILTLRETEVSIEETIEIIPFLSSKGYEWEDDPNWKEEFSRLIAA